MLHMVAQLVPEHVHDGGKGPPPSWLSRFFTFSRRKAAGRWWAMIWAVSKKKCPLGVAQEAMGAPQGFLFRDAGNGEGLAWESTQGARRAPGSGPDLSSTPDVAAIGWLSRRNSIQRVGLLGVGIPLGREHANATDALEAVMRRPPMPAKRSIKRKRRPAGPGALVPAITDRRF